MGDGQTVNGHARTILAVSAVLSALAILAVALRFYTKTYKKGTLLYTDDWLILGGLVRSLCSARLDWLYNFLSLSDLLTEIRPSRLVLLSTTLSGSQSVALASTRYGPTFTLAMEFLYFPLPKSCYLMERSCL